jgi:hypothetical protein
MDLRRAAVVVAVVAGDVGAAVAAESDVDDRHGDVSDAVPSFPRLLKWRLLLLLLWWPSLDGGDDNSAVVAVAVGLVVVGPAADDGLAVEFVGDVERAVVGASCALSSEHFVDTLKIINYGKNQ